MRLGIFGGSFDPVHYAHLLLAETCRESCRLDEVWFMPTAVSPHKTSGYIATPKQRVEMLELALAGRPDMRVSTLELDRGGVSYTVDTLEEIHKLHPRAELFFLIGGDSLHDFANWREPAKICDLATLVAVGRPGSPPINYAAVEKIVSPERLAEIRKYEVQMPLVEFSSTNIRQRVQAGKSIRYRTPAGVERYIETQGLYR